MSRTFHLSIFMGLAAVVAGCGPTEKIVHFVREPWAVEKELERETGLRSNVSLNWDNMTFSKATVTFDQIPSSLTISEVASAIHEALKAKIHQQPKELVIEFKVRQ